MYTYQKLKEAIGYPKNEKKVKGSWTPNDIKAIFILRSCIIVAHHTSVTTVVLLDERESLLDRGSLGTKGTLHNLLLQRQLSCLEEIYLDVVYKVNPAIMDLDKYVYSLVNSASRLRYYGYIDVPYALYPTNEFAPEVKAYYDSCVINGVIDGCYATFKDRKSTLQYKSTGIESTWYTKFNLRPNDYKLDAPNSKLSLWLQKVKTVMEDRKIKETEQLKLDGINSALSTLYKQDLNYADDLVCLLNLRKKLSADRVKNDIICKSVKLYLQDVLNASYKTQVSLKDLQQSLSKTGINVGKNTKEEFVVKYYSNHNILVKDSLNYNLEGLVEKAKRAEGFIDLPDLLMKMCLRLLEKSQGSSDMVTLSAYMVLDVQEVERCGGDLKSMFKGVRNDINCVSWYVNFIVNMCGFTKETVNKGGVN